MSDAKQTIGGKSNIVSSVQYNKKIWDKGT